MSFTLKETIDLSNADYVSGHPALTRETKARFARYAEQVRKQGTVEVEYTKKTYDGLPYGRYWPDNNDCLARQSGRIRSYFLADEYVDIDIVKAAPSIMIELANEIGHRALIIRKYRDDFAGAVRIFKLTEKQIKTCSVHKKKSMTAEAIVKHVYNMVTFGAGDDAITSDLGFRVKPEKYQVFRAECHDIAERLIRGKYRDIAQKISSDKGQLAILALIIQEKESTYVRELMTEFQSADIPIISYIFDGVVCRRNDKIDGILKKWNADNDIQFIVKPWTEPLNDKMEAVDESVVVECDEEAVEKLLEMWPGRIVRGSVGWFVRMPGDNFWSYGENYVWSLIMDSKFVKPGNKIYGGNIAGCSSIFKYLDKHIEKLPKNETFIIDNNRATRGRVYFVDKYYDLALGKYIDITDNDVVPLCYIKRNAPKSTTDTNEALAFLMDLLGDKHTVDTMLHALSRALGGFVNDKVWYLLKGARNSGKGMLQEICHLAFGDYIAIGDAPGIRPLSGDPAQEARWIISSGAITKRALLGNEIKSKSEWDVQKLDGSALKKYYASGGDIVQSRLHGQQECDVVNNTTFFLSLNENPTSNPPDAMETCRPIIFPYKFVSEDMVGKHHSYRLADPNLKSRLHSNEKIRDGFLRLVLEGFRPKPIKVKMMPIESQIDYDGFMKKCLTEPAQVLLKLFNQDPTLWEASANIHKAFESTHKSTHAIGRFLKSSGFTRTQKNSEWGYSGLALKPENEDEDEDEDSLPNISPPTPPATPPPPPKIEAVKPVLVMRPRPVQKIASLSMEDLPKKSYLEQEKEIMDMISNMDLH